VVREHLSRYRRRHSVVLLPVLVRAERGLVAHLRPRPRAQGVRRPLRRQVRTSPQSTIQHQGDGGRVRRRIPLLAGRSGLRRVPDLPLPGERKRRVDDAETTRPRRRRPFCRHHDAHRAVGPLAGPRQQAGRDHRHGSLCGTGDSRDRPDRRDVDRLSADADLVPTEARRPAARTRTLGDADTGRHAAAAGTQPGLRRADVHDLRPVLHRVPPCTPRGEDGQDVPEARGRRPRGPREAHASLRGRLQTAGLPQLLSVDVQPRQRGPGHRTDRPGHRDRHRHNRWGHPRGRRTDPGHRLQGDGRRQRPDLPGHRFR